MRGSRIVAAGIVCLFIATACRMAAPGEDGQALEIPAADPAQDLHGLALPGIRADGIDVVLRIGAQGFRLPPDESFFRAFGDGVLSIRGDTEGGNEWVVVRDLEGKVIRELDAGMQLVRAGFIHGDDVYFAGVDYDYDAQVTTDRGAWVARGDDPPEPLIDTTATGRPLYTQIKVSPDGRTIGIGRCVDETCGTIVIHADGGTLELPKSGLLELTNEVALLLDTASEMTAYSTTDGSRLWSATTDEVYDRHFATTDGAKIVMGSTDDPMNSDHVRIEVLNALNGSVERSVLVSTDQAPPWIAPTASSDRFVALIEDFRPRLDKGQVNVRVVDLAAGRLLDSPLKLGDVP